VRRFLSFGRAPRAVRTVRCLDRLSFRTDRRGYLQRRNAMSEQKRTVSIPQWAALIGMAEDGRSLLAARALIEQGDGPEVVRVCRRRRTDSGIRLRDHGRWVGTNEWAKFLAAEVAKKRRK
jgi:hypothetical protein